MPGSRLLIAILILALGAPGTASAGAWLRSADGYYFKLAGSYLYSTREYNSDGDEVDILAGEELITNTSFRDVTMTAYLEYGVSEQLTLVAKLPYRILTSERTETTDIANLTRNIEAINGGLSDLEIGARVPILQRPVVSFQGSVKIPMGYRASPDNGGAPLGSGKVDLDGHILVGTSLWPFPGWLGTSVGYRVRGGDLDDEFLFTAEAGANWRTLTFQVTLDGLYATNDPPDTERAATLSVVNSNALKVMPSIAWTFRPGAAFVVEAFHVLSGKNTTAGTTWSGSLSLSR